MASSFQNGVSSSGRRMLIIVQSLFLHSMWARRPKRVRVDRKLLKCWLLPRGMGLLDRLKTEEPEAPAAEEKRGRVEAWLRERVPRYDDGVERLGAADGFGAFAIRLTEPVDGDIYDIGMHLHGYRTDRMEEDGEQKIEVHAPVDTVGGRTEYVRDGRCTVGREDFVFLAKDPVNEDGALSNTFDAARLNQAAAYLRTAHPTGDEAVYVEKTRRAGEERIRVVTQTDGREQEAYVRPQRLLDPEENTTTGERVIQAVGVERGVLHDAA